MKIDEFIRFIGTGGNKLAVVHAGANCTYRMLHDKIMQYSQALDAQAVHGVSVLLQGNYSIDSICMLLALWLNRNAVALSVPKPLDQTEALAVAVGARVLVEIGDGAAYRLSVREDRSVPAAIQQLLSAGEACFVVFSSGTTGPAKGVIHRLSPFLERYLAADACGVLLAFLLFDHIGGLVTVLHALAQQGTLVIPAERSPQEVGRCIEAVGVETLHVSPSLLNLALLSGAFRGRGLSSLRRVYYGTEPVSGELLTRIENALPGVEMRQLYGMSEIGVLPCLSKSNDSAWIKVDAAGYQLRLVDGMLQIKGHTNMVGYLGGEAPLTEDGYFITGDLAEERDGYFRVTGRASDMINVGGKKVFPHEVERVLEKIENVQEVVVYGVPNPLLGQIIAACFVLEKPEHAGEFKARLYKSIQGALSPVQVPRVISISEQSLYSSRFKKIRNPDALAKLNQQSTTERE